MAASASTEWARVANTTIREYIRKVEDTTKRNRKWLALMEQRGRVVYNKGGDGFDWKVRFRRANMEVNNGEQTIVHDRINRYVSAFLDYEGYITKDKVTKREKLKNRSNEAIVKFFAEAGQLLTNDIRDQFAEEIYVDSSATGNSGRMTGLESMFALSNTDDTINITTGASRTKNAADVVGAPDDTYAGLDTDLGAKGGSWDNPSTGSTISQTWPMGTGDYQFDYWSPVVVNYTSTEFGGTTATWKDQCVSATRFGIEAVNSRNLLEGGQIDTVLLDRDLFRQYKEKLDSKERIPISSSVGLRSLGFKDVIEQDGVEITSEYGVPAAVGYGLNINAMQFRSMQDKLFVLDPIHWSPELRAFLFAVDCLGQFKFNSPRGFFKLAKLA